MLLMVLGGHHSASAQSTIRLHDVTAASGIAFQHTDGGSGERYLIEAIGAGLATFDYDRDGRIDIYFLNGAPLKGLEVEVPPTNACYRHLGDFHFMDVSRQSGIGDLGYGLGVTAGDFNNDGFPDLYLNNFGPNVFYRNNGDGTFTDITASTKTINGDKVGAGASFFDMEGDGDLDLYVANYVKFSYEKSYPDVLLGHVVYPGPMVFPPEPDNVFCNNGDGTFRDVSATSGVGQYAEWGMGTICGDFDNDGDSDVFVCNDSTRNFFFENDGAGKFAEVGVLAGLAFDFNGAGQGSMGVDCADYNHDGWLDLYQTSYQRQLAVLYENLGQGLFEDATIRTGAGTGTYHLVNWGVGFVDFDNDADCDLFLANGHIHDNLAQFDTSTTYEIPNQLLLNTGNGKFRDASADSGDGLAVARSSRGAAFDDLDNDGDVDVVVLNSRRAPTILRNKRQNAHHWIQLQLVGVTSNRDGVGARVRVTAGRRTQVAEVHSGRGYQSHYGTRLHFGLGERDHVERIEVQWIGGETDRVSNVAADQLLTIIQGRGQEAVPTPYSGP